MAIWLVAVEMVSVPLRTSPTMRVRLPFIVANAFGDSLTFIDPKTGDIQRTVRNILDPYHLRFSPDMKWFVTAANRLNHVDIYRWDGKDLTLAKRIPTSKTPSHLWIDGKRRPSG